MLSKLRELPSFSFKKKSPIDIVSIRDNLSNGLFGVMESSFANRQSDINNSKYSENDIESIIQKYAKKNMILAATTSIVPGPFGILGSIPELLLNFTNQMNMMYDLGCANGKESFINKDVLLDLPLSVFGGNTNLTKIQNSNYDLLDSSQDVLKEKAAQLGQSIVERTLKKSIIQFVPVAGPILMGTWAKMTTHKISSSAIDFLSNKEQYIEHYKPEETEETKRLLQQEKIKALANLIESNNEINENQINLINVIIENSDLTEEEKQFYLKESLKAGSKFDLDYKLLSDYEEVDDLIMQLVIMAKRSGNLDLLERDYIYGVGQSFGLEYEYLESLF